MCKIFKRNSQESFTIIELVLVILLVVIIGIVAIVRMPDLKPARLNMAAFKMQSDIRYAHLIAMNSQLRTVIVFNVGLDSYTLYIEPHPYNNDWQPLTDPVNQKIFTVQLNSEEFKDVDITQVLLNEDSNGLDILAFDRYGIPWVLLPPWWSWNFEELSGTGEIRLNEGAKYIIVTPNTGWINIQDTPS